MDKKPEEMEDNGIHMGPTGCQANNGSAVSAGNAKLDTFPTGWDERYGHIYIANVVLMGTWILAKFLGPTWGPPGSCRPQMGPIMAHELCYQGWA